MFRYFLRSLIGRSLLQRTLHKHFRGVPPGEILTAAREFPLTSRVDVQIGLEQLFAERGGAKLLGIHSPMNQETSTMAHVFTAGPSQ
jgi:hypothetical protein